MRPKIMVEGYRVMNIGGGKGKAADAPIRPNIVRVLAPDGTVVASVQPTSRNPLRYIRTKPSSIYRVELVRQLTDARVPASVIKGIVDPE